MTREMELHYWWCRGRSDAYLGHCSMPGWISQWAQGEYLRGYYSMKQEAKVTAGQIGAA